MTITKAKLSAGEKKFVMDAIERHTAPVPESGCWLWMRSVRGQKGYGQITLPGRKQISAHRAAYMAFVDDVPNGMHVCHKCDVPLCCNPNHLFIGTPSDNAVDAVEKGRWNPGRVGAPRKISDTQIDEIKKMRFSGMLQREIAERFGVSQVRVSQLLRSA